MKIIHLLHSQPFFAVHRLLTKLFLGKLDYLVVQSHESQHLIQKHLPKKKVVYVRGPQLDLIPRTNETISKELAQKKLQIKGDVLLFFGFVRPYKGLKILLNAMPAILAQRPKLTLLVVGEYWGDQAEYENIIDALHIREHVKLVNRFVKDEEMPLYFSAADAVILPYTAISQSAVIPTALSFGVPILASNVGGNAEWVNDGKNGLLFSAGSENEITEKVIQFYQQKLEKKMRLFITKNIDQWKWSKKLEQLILQQKNEI
ncbi:MAG: glycosyltransferase [Candidatus Diapherotrites archaeon]|uniref:Glycosyltransferase n=1 Tax=Candidatus Iainarchaeum sp. TaxID=3101447 RepID=A0A8T4C5H3_9ARCH|nr:glycosyltransferase [Candidatus Diapherotrites archaeon]